MPRVISAAINSQTTDAVLTRLREMDGVLSIQVYPQASVKTPGDTLVIIATNTSLPRVMDLLGGDATGRPSSLTVSEPAAVFSAADQEAIETDQVESIWEESETFLRRSSYISMNYLLLMALGGGLVAAGLAMGVLPLILGAAVLMPSFEPISYLGWGIGLRQRHTMWRGIQSTLLGYALAVATAAAAFVVLQWTRQASLTEFLTFPLLPYWTSVGLSSLIVTVFAATAGAVVITTHRSVLTAGVSLALSLVPSTGIMGIALAARQWEYVWRGLGQWTLNVVTIAVISAVIVLLKNRWFHQRRPWY